MYTVTFVHLVIIIEQWLSSVKASIKCKSIGWCTSIGSKPHLNLTLKLSWFLNSIVRLGSNRGVEHAQNKSQQISFIHDTFFSVFRRKKVKSFNNLIRLGSCNFIFCAVDLKVPNPRSHPIIHPRHTNGRLFCQYKSTDLSQRLDSSLKVKLWFTIDRVVEEMHEGSPSTLMLIHAIICHLVMIYWHFCHPPSVFFLNLLWRSHFESDFLIEAEHDAQLSQQFMRNHRNLYATALKGNELKVHSIQPLLKITYRSQLFKK